MPYLTGDSLGGVCKLIVTLPDDLLTREAVIAQIYELTKVERWETYGLQTAEDTAAKMLEAYESIELCPTEVSNAVEIGTILPYYGALPANWLDCDFSLKTQAAYPELYAAVDASLIVDASNFRLPPQPLWRTALTKAYSASSQSGANNPANLDDSNLSTIWVAGAAPTQWVEIAFNYPVLVTAYKINCGTNTSTTRPKTWAFQAYIDGVWTDVHTQVNVTLNGSQEYSYSVDGFHARWRMNITASQGGSTSPALATFQLTYSEIAYRYGIVAQNAV